MSESKAESDGRAAVRVGQRWRPVSGSWGRWGETFMLERQCDSGSWAIRWSSGVDGLVSSTFYESAELVAAASDGATLVRDVAPPPAPRTGQVWRAVGRTWATWMRDQEFTLGHYRGSAWAAEWPNGHMSYVSTERLGESDKVEFVREVVPTLTWHGVSVPAAVDIKANWDARRALSTPGNGPGAEGQPRTGGGRVEVGQRYRSGLGLATVSWFDNGCAILLDDAGKRVGSFPLNEDGTRRMGGGGGAWSPVVSDASAPNSAAPPPPASHDEPIRITSQEQADALFGKGSFGSDAFRAASQWAAKAMVVAEPKAAPAPRCGQTRRYLPGLSRFTSTGVVRAEDAERSFVVEDFDGHQYTVRMDTGERRRLNDFVMVVATEWVDGPTAPETPREAFERALSLEARDAPDGVSADRWPGLLLNHIGEPALNHCAIPTAETVRLRAAQLRDSVRGQWDAWASNARKVVW